MKNVIVMNKFKIICNNCGKEISEKEMSAFYQIEHGKLDIICLYINCERCEEKEEIIL